MQEILHTVERNEVVCFQQAYFFPVEVYMLETFAVFTVQVFFNPVLISYILNLHFCAILLWLLLLKRNKSIYIEDVGTLAGDTASHKANDPARILTRNMYTSLPIY